MNKNGVSDRLAEIDKRIDSDELLNDEQRAAIKARAREHVRKKQVERETDRLFALEVKRAEIEMAEGDDEIVEIVIDLPRYAHRMTIDGMEYYHGLTYEVPQRKYRSMLDTMARSWEHNREIHGDRRQADVNRDPDNRGVNLGRNADNARNMSLARRQRLNTTSSLGTRTL
jgi:hypothetical protein